MLAKVPLTVNSFSLAKIRADMGPALRCQLFQTIQPVLGVGDTPGDTQLKEN